METKIKIFKKFNLSFRKNIRKEKRKIRGKILKRLRYGTSVKRRGSKRDKILPLKIAIYEPKGK